jgi:hypothetical protein
MVSVRPSTPLRIRRSGVRITLGALGFSGSCRFLLVRAPTPATPQLPPRPALVACSMLYASRAASRFAIQRTTSEAYHPTARPRAPARFLRFGNSPPRSSCQSVVRPRPVSSSPRGRAAVVHRAAAAPPARPVGRSPVRSGSRGRTRPSGSRSSSSCRRMMYGGRPLVGFAHPLDDSAIVPSAAPRAPQGVPIPVVPRRLPSAPARPARGEGHASEVVLL